MRDTPWAVQGSSGTEVTKRTEDAETKLRRLDWGKECYEEFMLCSPACFWLEQP